MPMKILADPLLFYLYLFVGHSKSQSLNHFPILPVVGINKFCLPLVGTDIGLNKKIKSMGIQVAPPILEIGSRSHSKSFFL